MGHASGIVKYNFFFGVKLILLSITGKKKWTFFYGGGRGVGGGSRNPSLRNYPLDTSFFIINILIIMGILGSKL